MELAIVRGRTKLTIRIYGKLAECPARLERDSGRLEYNRELDLDKKKMISIITATYNAAETLRDCLECVKSQTTPGIEHILVDGGSTDTTLEIVSEYRDNLAQVISEPDSGIYDAMNKGLG